MTMSGSDILKIAFRIDSGVGIGMGHLTRMSALADAFGEYGGESSFFRSEDEPIDYTGFDLVVADSYKLSDQYISDLNETGRFVLCYDDNALYEYSCDALLNVNLHANELTFRFGSKKPKLLLGGKYTLLRREFWSCESIKIRERASRVFVCFGGTDIRNITPVIVSAIQDISGVEVVAVLGAVTCCDEELMQLSKENVEIIKDPISISQIMKTCDIAVISASSMVYEIAALGIPALTITQIDNQEMIADYLGRYKLMKCIGDWDDLSTIDLVNEVKSLLSDIDRRKNESARLRSTVHCEGALTAAGEIVRLMNETVR
ncbi:UDP-2,4-diacetamido-2,4,6-trideoxy-beta-L-altropyranose hydrolase [Clostridia bacterium]|nr:UDP-2,4-diacetamido-2,4,6-trideoxy-beta-L-altropyranose hydrolase [Clostridia bacterium]